MSAKESTPRRLHARRDTIDGVHLWSEPVVIPTYEIPPPDRNPMFLENRVYQGSSGRVYPLPVYDRVSKEKVDRVYEAVHLENEYVYLMMLPEIGGRIHIGYDKLAGYDFFYRQDVVKPALVGLAGPWISGGVEFNWPQHHRPSTFMPCEWWLEESEDGSKTVWLSEHEPMGRMKGMHGVCLRPGSSLVELKVRLYNRTPHVQTFLWWANVAARVHGNYQSFFPPDVRFVADHAKRATSTFPACSDSYYGVRYGERGRDGVPEAERPPMFHPDASVPPDRLDWYANIPVPTSYMVVRTGFDFFGGYDHEAGAGFVHVADRHIAPGKKQWTWGNQEFGYAWDRNLTDEGGPYVELMAGVYTDNQPDFSYLAPYETKSFSQFWYPIRGIGPAANASRHAALSVRQDAREVEVAVCASHAVDPATVEIRGSTGAYRREVRLDPSEPLRIAFPVGRLEHVRVLDDAGAVLVAYEPTEEADTEPLRPAEEPPQPADVATTDELFLIGTHLAQYRHATRLPEWYWEEALRRDPLDSRCHLALGKWRLSRGEFELAAQHLRASIHSQTRWNPNPYDGEAHYQLGLALEFLRRDADAVEAFAKAGWNAAWKPLADLAMARVAARAGRFSDALARLGQAKPYLGEANIVGCAASALHRAAGKPDEAFREASAVLARDPLDHWALFEARAVSPGEFDDRLKAAMRDDPQSAIDLAFDFLAFGLPQDAEKALREFGGGHPIVAYLLRSLGREAPVERRDYTFPHRLEEMRLLQETIEREPGDAYAHELLGCLLYDKRRREEAVRHWERAVELAPESAIVWRNLGIAYHNVAKDPERSQAAYARAIAAAPDDPRLLYEQDQLLKRLGVALDERIAALERREDLVAQRDDLTLELCALYNQTGKPARAQALLAGRPFSPWEGGEGVALGQHARAHAALARKAMSEGRADDAVELLRAALDAPENLGEARHLLANASDLWVALAEALEAAGRPDEARAWLGLAADFRGDFQQMAVKSFSEMTYYRVLALRRLGRLAEADRLADDLADHARDLERQPAKIDYFATSLPTMLLFDDDLQGRQTTTARFLAAQAALLRGDVDAARRGLEDVLARDPNHALAHDLLAEVSA